MPDEFDKRLREVENKVYSFEQTFGRIADDIHDIKENIQEFIEVKSKLSSIDIVFKRIDELRKEIQSLDKSITPMVTFYEQSIQHKQELVIQLNAITGRITKLEFEHETCSKLKDSTINFVSGRFGTVFDWLIKLALGALLFYAAKYGIKS